MANLYLLALMPPEHLAEEIQEIRKECAEKFNVQAALKPPVHITLYRIFKSETNYEKQLIRLLHQECYRLTPFKQELENFDSFNTHTVFITAAKNPGINAVHRSISSVFRKHRIDPQEHKGNNQFHPHITIAYRDIPAETFPDIWAEYKDQKFKRSFHVNRFTLLKHDGVRWNILEEFSMKKVEQMSLFT